MDIKDFEKMFEGKGFSEPQKTYLMAEAWLKSLKDCEKEIDQKIVDENEFFYPEDECGHKKGERIKDGFDICVLSKTEDFERYLNLVDIERNRMGFSFKHNESMTYEATKLFNQAANALVDWGFEKLREYTNDCPDTGVDYIKKNIVAREKFCNITMKLRNVD